MLSEKLEYCIKNLKRLKLNLLLFVFNYQFYLIIKVKNKDRSNLNSIEYSFVRTLSIHHEFLCNYNFENINEFERIELIKYIYCYDLYYEPIYLENSGLLVKITKRPCSKKPKRFHKSQFVQCIIRNL